MREISPAVGISADDFLRSAPDEVKQIVAEIRREKRAGLRKYPSAELLDCSRVLTTTQRKSLLDKVAALVDEISAVVLRCVSSSRSFFILHSLT
jgi:hypothetical protein